MKKILITAPVHQDIKIFKEYLWSLNRLEIPEGYEIHKYFYLHNAGSLKKFLNSNEYECINDDVKLENSDITHIWKAENFNAVCKMRTMALEKARKEKYDYIFSVDSDIILHSTTLKELLKYKKDIISKVWWTVYDLRQPWNYMPNCYDGMDKNGRRIFYTSIQNLKIMGLYTVGTVCGCNLISSKIFNNENINYFPIDMLSTSYWEDFAFSTRCKCVFPELQLYIDTSNPVKHLYRKEDYETWIKWEKIKWDKEF